MREIWKDIKDYEGLYQISNLGRVRSLDRLDKMGRIRPETIRIPRENRGGYLELNLSKNGKLKRFSVHRLVAEYFIENHDNKKTVNHIDGNKENNRVDNLEWASYKENINHAIEEGLLSYKNRANKTPLSEEQVISIYLKSKSGIKSKLLAEEYKITVTTVSRIKNKKSYKKLLEDL